MYDIVIIGAGIAGLSAAVYGCRAGKKVLVLEEAYYGGQIVNTPQVENYPGIKQISGADLATTLYEQAIGLGAEVVFERAKEIQNTEDAKAVATKEKKYLCKSIILATGAKNRTLGLEKERAFAGNGVSYCATCDGAFYKGKTVAVFGGGNTALAEVLHLSEECKTVYLIHRRKEFRAEARLQERAKEQKNVVPLLESTIVRILGEEKLKGIELENVVTKKRVELAIDGLFIAIGHAPDNKRFENLVELDQQGYVIAKEDCKTSMGGIFAAGDCRTKKVRQLTTAAADGAVAALAACEYIG